MSKESIPAIYESMAKVNEEIEAITKSQKGYGYNFRGIDDVFVALNPLFKKHKIITTRRNLQSERLVRTNAKGKEVVEVFIKSCQYVFKSLIDGSEIVSEGFGEGQDSSGGDKGSSMATSNSYKYVIFEMFNIPTKEQKDSDQVTAEENKQADNSAQSSTPAKPSSFGASAQPESKPQVKSGGFGGVKAPSRSGSFGG